MSPQRATALPTSLCLLLLSGCATAEKPAAQPAAAQPAAAPPMPAQPMAAQPVAPQAVAAQPVARPPLELQPVENRGRRENPPRVYDISVVSKTPRPRFQARPQYPLELRRAGVAGEGVVDFIVDTDGVVRDAVVVRATDVRFGEAALQSVVQWRFAPAELNGVPIACHMQVPIVFTLNER